jgi:undecaprenyl-phosphate 4-deoxy-4-formamido-L-arabinose transferase
MEWLIVIMYSRLLGVLERIYCVIVNKSTAEFEYHGVGRGGNNMTNPYLSIVVPVYNEADNLEKLYERLTSILINFGKTYEIILVNDGSRDNTEIILSDIFKRDPEKIRILHFNGNFGQHMAIMAGFERARGDVTITLDADLQNPPEEIPKLLQAIQAGHDYVGSIRKNRQDTWFRRHASRLNNTIRARITGIVMTDQGCMLRAYKRHVIEAVVASKESSIYIPALAYSYAANPTEVEVEHSPREAGESKYNLYKLLRLNFDLMTGFSLVPLQIFTFFGMVISALSTLFVIYLFIRRLFIGPEVEGIFTLFAILYFLIGVGLMGLGILGEYIGRIYKEVRQRPFFIIRNVLEKLD